MNGWFEKKLSREVFVGLLSVALITSVSSAQPFRTDEERPKDANSGDNPTALVVAAASDAPKTSDGTTLQDDKKVQPIPVSKKEQITKSKPSTGLYAGIGVAAAALVAAVAAGGSGGSGGSYDITTPGSPDSPSTSGSSGSSASGTCAGWSSNGFGTVYRFKDPIRIGDDQNYNNHHSDHFKISSPSGTSYSTSFNLPSGCNYTSAQIKYVIAACTIPAKIYLNGRLVGRSCNPGNTAYAVRECSPINVAGALKTGSNRLKISASIRTDDTVDPYDDIEIYDLQIVLTR